MKKVIKTGIFDYRNEKLANAVNKYYENFLVLSVDYCSNANLEWAYVTVNGEKDQVDKECEKFLDALEEDKNEKQ